MNFIKKWLEAIIVLSIVFLVAMTVMLLAYNNYQICLSEGNSPEVCRPSIICITR